MNEINASKRMKEAASEKAEADKVRPATCCVRFNKTNFPCDLHNLADQLLLVKAAEADAESKYLSGVGVARQVSVHLGIQAQERAALAHRHTFHTFLYTIFEYV